MNLLNFFRRPTIDVLRLNTLETAEQELHEAMLQAEYYAHIVPMLQARCARLRAALDKEPRK